jgi:hypothetical protein
MDVEPAQVEAALAGIKPQVEAQDFELVARLWSTLVLVMRLVRAQRASIARLRRLFGLSSSEKTRAVVGADTVQLARRTASQLRTVRHKPTLLTAAPRSPKRKSPR